MKLSKTLLFTSLILFLTFSCKEKLKNEQNSDENDFDIEQLLEKYSEYNFEDCDEFIKIADKIIDSYINTVDKAYKGDGKAFLDIDKYSDFIETYDSTVDKLFADCPEKLKTWSNKTENKLNVCNEKIKSLSNDELEGLHWDETEVEEELNRQLQELDDELKRVSADEPKN